MTFFFLGTLKRLIFTFYPKVPSLPNASPTSEDSAGGESPLCRRDVLFGDSVQDVVSALGAPARCVLLSLLVFSFLVE